MIKYLKIQETAADSFVEEYCFGSGKPEIFFTGGIHGNEVTGVYVAQKLVQFFTENPPVKGTVKIIPVVNKTGFRCMRRRNPFDGEDLNRIFPGDPKGSFGRRLADVVYRETENADIIVDLHCCGQHGLPYILSIYSESEKVRKLVSEIAMPVAVHSEGTPGQLFTESTRNRDQAACIIELPSGHSSGSVNLEVAAQCYAGLMSMLRTEGFAAGAPDGKAPTFYGTLLDAEAQTGGLWMPAAEKGTEVKEGQVIGTVDGTDVLAPADGFIMNILPCSYIFPGDLWVMTYIQEEK